MDYDMPECNGLDSSKLIKEFLKQKNAKHKTKICFHSAFIDQNIEKKC